jgi:hypothetical protein
VSWDIGTTVRNDMTPRRQESAIRRDEILCALARQLPPKDGDSPTSVARWLKEQQLAGFPGLVLAIGETEERLAFQRWVTQSKEGNLVKRVQRAFKSIQVAKPEKSVAPPPLVWPLGMRQRKERDSTFKLPWLYGDNGGSDRIFLECLGDTNLHRVSIMLAGQQVGFTPVLRPGTFVEIDWPRNSEVNRIATWSGWREAILAQHSNKNVAETLRGIHYADSAVGELQRQLANLAEGAVARVEKVMPPDFENWKALPRPYSLEVKYDSDGGKSSGTLAGTLVLNMERLWYGFRDSEGNRTPIH